MCVYQQEAVLEPSDAQLFDPQRGTLAHRTQWTLWLPQGDQYREIAPLFSVANSL
jgi:hypothetical protein